VRLSVPAAVLRLMVGAQECPHRLEAVQWGPTCFDLSVQTRDGRRRILRLASGATFRRWLHVLAPLVRFGVHDGRLWWRPHPPGLLLSLDTLFWRRAK